MSNRKPAPEAAPEAAPVEAAPEANEALSQSGIQIETQFEIVDNTAADAAPERVAEAAERTLDNGMIVVDYV